MLSKELPTIRYTIVCVLNKKLYCTRVLAILKLKKIYIILIQKSALNNKTNKNIFQSILIWENLN